jgi:hypothetical protein
MNALDVLLHKAMQQAVQNEIDRDRLQHIEKNYKITASGFLI